MIYPKFKKLKHYKKIAITFFIIFALASFWYGVWRIYDIYFTPYYPLATAIAAIIVGAIGLSLSHYSLS